MKRLLPVFALWLQGVLWVIAVGIGSVSGVRAQTPERYEFTEIHMGVPVRLIVYSPNEETAKTACRAAFDRIAALEDILSDYRPTSELMRLCTQAGGEPIPVSAELFHLLEYSQNIAQQTEGAFDVTVGALVRLWRTARKTQELPSVFALRAAKATVGWEKVVLESKKRTVRLTVPGMLLDMGGIAKGYACDEAQRVLKRHGIRSALVEAGGDIVVSAAPPDQKGWRVEVDGQTHELSHCAISTSGDLNQFVELGGKRYSHIVDPHTGLGLTHRLVVTIIAKDGITSDSLATALSVLGKEKGAAFAKHFPRVISVTIRTAQEEE